MMKLLFKPFAIITGVVASKAAGAIFKTGVWPGRTAEPQQKLRKLVPS